MKKLIEAIVKPLVDFPDEVRVDVAEERDRIVYKLSVHPDDLGKVIGKNGRMAKAIRTVVYAHAAATKKKKTYLDIQ